MEQTEFIVPQIVDCMHFFHTMAPGEKPCNRIVNHYEIDINLTGERVMWVENVRYDITPGSVVCRLPGQHVASLGHFNMYALTLDFTHPNRNHPPYVKRNSPSAQQPAFQSYYWRTLPTLFQPKHAADLIGMYRDISLMFRFPDKQAETDALLSSLLHLLLADAFALRETGGREPVISPVTRVIAYIHEHYMQKITLDTLASVAALDKSYLVRLFKKETDMTPIEYLNHIRLSSARNLLVSSGAPIQWIAEQCGFDASAYFISRFHLAFGVTPQAYRRANRKT